MDERADSEDDEDEHAREAVEDEPEARLEATDRDPGNVPLEPPSLTEGPCQERGAYSANVMTRTALPRFRSDSWTTSTGARTRMMLLDHVLAALEEREASLLELHLDRGAERAAAGDDDRAPILDAEREEHGQRDRERDERSPDTDPRDERPARPFSEQAVEHETEERQERDERQPSHEARAFHGGLSPERGRARRRGVDRPDVTEEG